MRINGKTLVAGIFGDPITHTLSPAMHNAAFKAVGLNAVFVPFHVKAGQDKELKAAVEGIRAMNLLGVNITIPHKEKVMKYLDEIDPFAMDLGAVNTVVNRGGRLVGYNTDGAGYLLSLRDETGFRPARKKIIIIGAGGAARSILYSMLGMKPSTVVLVNRTVKRADSLAKAFAQKFSLTDIKAVVLQRAALIEHFAYADLVVNTTSMGMMGKGALDLPLEALPPKAIVSDIVYRPLRTDLLKGAERRGLKTHEGLGMLVRQGAIGFELWTGKKAPVAVMEEAAKKALRQR
ncbi:MAG TPA: shikimate dehydrogenase [Deltaproteobacteria bacterium]|nr:MAG: shikimate dehydrogenase [Deltaproteobacteria bacterium GWA2_55_82]OGQ62599.1 MAG: shikimate dehydrogenase [Deltaproteobacteria bacterium RIFCSPLOWO2_02_FULL_55_12]OIJ74188.1 MAG: shikimate dehydrogenase [Deltaproteobacteria bacterium GWC2_55_46]HBG46810.1 shikimate dehydrogenase [Deltaproteobacteria bacterium]HCY11181.1 shikimate dehydrogenase [Deltaproteobacteria bacterium]